MINRDDGVLLAPDRQDGQTVAQVQAVKRADALPAVVNH